MDGRGLISLDFKNSCGAQPPSAAFTDIRLDTLQEPASLDCSENTKANCQWLSAKCLFPVAPALLRLKYEVLVFVPRHSADDLDKGLLWLSAEC
jgi:hypothetical protein